MHPEQKQNPRRTNILPFTDESDKNFLMQWSPVKLARNKRTLDVVGEADDTLGESEDEREDGEMSEEDKLEGSDADCYPGPEVNSDIINAQEQDEAPPEPDEPAEQLEARSREQTLSSHEI